MHAPRPLSIGIACLAGSTVVVAGGSYVGGIDFTLLGWALGANAFVGGLMLCLLTRVRSSPSWIAPLGALLLGAGFPFAINPWFSHDLRLAAFARCAEHAKPLVAAIHAYEAHDGHPPPTLSALVPKYLEAIPSTGIWTHPEFTYLASTPPAFNPGTRTWSLQVELFEDSFVYDPEHSQPPSPSTRRFEDWFYHFW